MQGGVNDGGGLLDESRAKLKELGLKQGDRFGYVYDFGDNWEHSLWVEEIRAADKRSRLPICLGGGRACPPEDVGGIHRFRSEEEVQPVFLAHVLARGADLITGGEGRRWRLTDQGESFSTQTAFAQVWALLRAW